MNGRLTSAFDRGQHARRSRALAYVLLVLIGYGSTLGVTHRHGNLSPRISQPNAYTTITNSLAARDVTTSTTNRSKSGDCLVCQFQQSLSNGELCTPVVIHASTKSPSIIRVLAVSFLSNIRSTRQGRAPPVTC